MHDTTIDPLADIDERVTALQAELRQLRDEAILLEQVQTKQRLNAALLETMKIKASVSTARCERNALRQRAQP